MRARPERRGRACLRVRAGAGGAPGLGARTPQSRLAQGGRVVGCRVRPRLLSPSPSPCLCPSRPALPACAQPVPPGSRARACEDGERAEGRAHRVVRAPRPAEGFSSRGFVIFHINAAFPLLFLHRHTFLTRSVRCFGAWAVCRPFSDSRGEVISFSTLIFVNSSPNSMQGWCVAL